MATKNQKQYTHAKKKQHKNKQVCCICYPKLTQEGEKGQMQPV